ncbi:hypothetical protein CK203_080974 [Vitis vinifera]|uniref:Uncharacterized protein n=1 Tax=Vitis vinifera TaxID=29760 RepID=A0A438EMU6_VITVI|nr:hypothetical protein CK203_080974 [Vitis vinifera]
MVMGWVYGEQSEKNGTLSKEEFASLLAKDRWVEVSYSPQALFGIPRFLQRCLFLNWGAS